jgi:hypothetical protein
MGQTNTPLCTIQKKNVIVYYLQKKKSLCTMCRIIGL